MRRQVEKLHRVFRLGIVKTQDTANCRVRVSFTDLGGVQSYWLPVVVPKAQNDKFYWLPDVGEQVVCLMDDQDEAGVVLGAIYSQADSAPVSSADKAHISFKDGSTFEYDRASHTFAAQLAGGTSIVVADGVTTINAGSNPISLISTGTINVQGGNVVLAGGGPAIALVGGQVLVPNVQSGTETIIGNIIPPANSTKVTSA